MRDNGQSIAKKWLRHQGGAHRRLARRRSARLIWLRNVVNMVLGIIPLYGIIDVLFIFGESRQCLHDKIADTIVIKA